MVEDQSKSFQALVKHLASYPDQAFLFVREGLAYASERIHGPETEAHRHLHRYLMAHQLDWDDLIGLYHAGELPDPVVDAIEEAGGCDKLNRHVSGRELCWALRDYALQRWGMLARAVLKSWNIEGTDDFGRIVFGFIDFDMMQKQPEDSPQDFEDVYSFNEAFDSIFRTGNRDDGPDDYSPAGD